MFTFYIEFIVLDGYGIDSFCKNIFVKIFTSRSPYTGYNDIQQLVHTITFLNTYIYYFRLIFFLGGFVIEDNLRRNFTVQPLSDDRRNWLIGNRILFIFEVYWLRSLCMPQNTYKQVDWKCLASNQC